MGGLARPRNPRRKGSGPRARYRTGHCARQASQLVQAQVRGRAGRCQWACGPVGRETDLHTGIEREVRLATLDNPRVRCPSQPASKKRAVEWISKPNRPRLDLPSSLSTRLFGSLTRARVPASTEIAVDVQIDRRRLEPVLVERLDAERSQRHWVDEFFRRRRRTLALPQRSQTLSKGTRLRRRLSCWSNDPL